MAEEKERVVSEMPEELQRLELNLSPNEASGLLTIQNEGLLEEHGWEVAFWVVMDEGPVERCIGVMGHARGADSGEGWEIDRFVATAPDDVSGRTEDSESVAGKDGFVYVIGSHYGSKDGPLQPKRGFIARFREDEVQHAFEDPVVGLEVYRESFALHRLINDALSERDLIPLGPETRRAMISRTIERGEEEDKEWAGLVREGDYPLNFEGAAFRKSGNLLLGLRFPTSASGLPLLVEVEGIERLFDQVDSRGPEVVGLWEVNAVGKEGEMAGVRDLALVPTEDGEELHLVTGNIDSKKGGSVLIKDYEAGRDTFATHFRCSLPPNRSSGSLDAEFVREFPELPRVEGISITEDGRFFYVTDEDEGVHLRLTRLLSD